MLVAHLISNKRWQTKAGVTKRNWTVTSDYSTSDCLTQTRKQRVACFSSSCNLLMGVSAVVIRYWWLGVWRVSAPRETHPRAQSNEWNIISSIMGFVLLSPSCLNSETRIISTKGWGFYLSAAFFFSSFSFFLFPLLHDGSHSVLFSSSSFLSVSLAVPGKKKVSIVFQLNCCP